MKTIAIPEELHKKLLSLKLEYNNKNLADLMENMLIEYRKYQFLKASNLVRDKMKKNKVSLGDLLKKSKVVREEVANEWFS